MNIWPVIKYLEGKTLYTLAQRKSFKISDISENHLIILIHSTNKKRKIQKTNIEKAADFLFTHGTLTRKQIRDRFSEANPAYVAGILAKLPGVEYENKPITLLYQK